MDPKFVENVAASLVREYLSRKGLTETLEMMDTESPRENDSISNRMQLMKAIHIEKLMKKNKEFERPFKSMLEVIAHYFVEKAAGRMDTLERPRKSGRSSAESKRSPSDSTQGSTDMPVPTTTRNTASKNRGSKDAGDLVLEDAPEGETFLGEGKSGLMNRTETLADRNLNVLGRSRPKSAKHRGMSGPITSNLEERDRRRPHASRHKHHSGRYRPDPASSDSSSSSSGPPPIEPLTAAASRKTSHARDSGIGITSPTPRQSSRHMENSRDVRSPSGGGRSTYGQTQIEDVLDVDADTRRPGSSRLERQSGKTIPGSVEPYSVQKSSISKDTPPTRKGLLDILAPDLASNKNNLSNTTTATTTTSGVFATSTPQSKYSSLTTASPSTSTKRTPAMTRVGDLEIGDMDDLDNDVGSHVGVENRVQRVPMCGTKSPAALLPVESKPIDTTTAVDLKMLIFGSATQNFNDEWRHQSFTFCDLPRLLYGIVQKKGGPCGILASVQACLLQELLFSSPRNPTPHSLEVSRSQRTELLSAALANIFWRAGDQTQAVVALPGYQAHVPGSSRFKTDGITEKLNLYSFKKCDQLSAFLHQQISQFELDGTSGVILALYSVILSRSIQRCREDMDEPNGKLMGAHGYCSQDMVNLILTGKATSNVFNDIMELDGGVGPKTVLKGVVGRSDIGLLSLFEHYRSCKVGSNLKTPRFPIWVVCSESHFSVLFSLKRELLSDWKAERRFDLYYYDGLAKQEEEIRLTVDTTNRYFQAPDDDDLVPPIDLCIRTKWKDAEIDWNGTEPLL